MLVPPLALRFAESQPVAAAGGVAPWRQQIVMVWMFAAQSDLCAHSIWMPLSGGLGQVVPHVAHTFAANVPRPMGPPRQHS